MLMFKNVKKSFSCLKLQNLISAFSKYWRVRSRLSSSWIDLYAVLALQPILNLICINSAPLWHTGVSMRDLFFFFYRGQLSKHSPETASVSQVQSVLAAADPCWVKRLPRNLVWMPTLPFQLLTDNERAKSVPGVKLLIKTKALTSPSQRTTNALLTDLQEHVSGMAPV